MMQYATLREKIAAESAARRERYAKFEVAYQKAVEAGLAAGKAAMPTPMIVSEADGLSDAPKPGGKSWFVADGVCGFAWVNVRPANSSFAKWLVKTGKAHGRAYHGGVDIWVSEFGQSMQRKQACAQAMAEVLHTELGITVYPGSRMD